MSAVEVVHAPERSRFTATVQGQTALLTYVRRQGAVAMTHTLVPREIEGRGIAGKLTAAAVAWAREQGLEIDAQCSYVRGWLARERADARELGTGSSRESGSS